MTALIMEAEAPIIRMLCASPLCAKGNTAVDTINPNKHSATIKIKNISPTDSFKTFNSFLLFCVYFMMNSPLFLMSEKLYTTPEIHNPIKLIALSGLTI